MCLLSGQGGQQLADHFGSFCFLSGRGGGGKGGRSLRAGEGKGGRFLLKIAGGSYPSKGGGGGGIYPSRVRGGHMGPGGCFGEEGGGNMISNRCF